MTVDLRFLAWKMRKYALPFLVLTLAGVAATFSVTATMPAMQTASARLLFESAELEKQTRSSTSATRQAERLEIIRYSLQRPETMLRVADEFTLFAQHPPADRIRQMRAHFTFRTVPRKDSLKMMTLSFRHPEAERAADVANFFAGEAILINRDMLAQDTSGSLEFFLDDLRVKEATLETARSELSEFRAQNANSLPDREFLLLERKTRLEDTLAGQVTRSFRAPVEAVKVREANRLEASLTQARETLPDNHPKILELEAAIGQLRIHRDMAADLQSRSGRSAELQRELDQIKTWLAAIPEVSATLNALTYDHDVAQTQHLAALDRLADARIRRQVEDVVEGQRLTVIEYAIPPETRPNQKKQVLFWLGAAVSLAVAAIAVFLLSRADPRIRRPVDLERALGITPFATLPSLSAEPALIRLRRI
ncbi:MAG: hypothetical protein AAGA12_05770 [Pseudomonadota bacterium]